LLNFILRKKNQNNQNMKKHLLLAGLILLISLSNVMAQNGQRRSPEERAKAMITQLAPLQLSAEQQQQTEAVFVTFFEQQQKAAEEARSGGNFDREAFSKKRQELAASRDVQLGKIFTEEQMKKWKDSIEPSLKTRKNQPAPTN